MFAVSSVAGTSGGLAVSRNERINEKKGGSTDKENKPRGQHKYRKQTGYMLFLCCSFLSDIGLSAGRRCCRAAGGRSLTLFGAIGEPIGSKRVDSRSDAVLEP